METPEEGVVLLAPADHHRLGLTESVAAEMVDPRRQDLTRYPMTELPRERIYSLALGQRPADHADLAVQDPAMRMAVWRPGAQPPIVRGAKRISNPILFKVPDGQVAYSLPRPERSLRSSAAAVDARRLAQILFPRLFQTQISSSAKRDGDEPRYSCLV